MPHNSAAARARAFETKRLYGYKWTTRVDHVVNSVCMSLNRSTLSVGLTLIAAAEKVQ